MFTHGIAIWSEPLILKIYESYVGSSKNISECEPGLHRVHCRPWEQILHYIISMLRCTQDLFIPRGFIFVLTIACGVVNTLCLYWSKIQSKLPKHLNCECTRNVHSKLRNINLLDVTPSLISWNLMEHRFLSRSSSTLSKLRRCNPLLNRFSWKLLPPKLILL